ncbi:MAG: hypothetical protein CTY33_03020 [Methylotenera sp.]|nr:MAG: hypothetical protein CTY33_03020 [Methylotenera sp.]
MLTCKQVSQLISQSLDRPLTLTNRIQLKVHLVMCDACTRFKKQMQLLQVAVHRLRRQTESDSSIILSEAAKTRISHTVASKQQ